MNQRKSVGSAAMWVVGGGVAATNTLSASASASELQGPRVATCWGRNSEGQCNIPSSLGTVAAIAAGYSHTVALRSDGTIACWGSNYSGQCNFPSGLGTITAIAAGESHTVALKANGTVACWGYNSSGQCNVPAELGTVASVSAGALHSVALRFDGTLACWGHNAYGQCSVSSGLGIVNAIAAGSYHTLAVTQAGSVACWGRNDYGQSSVPSGLGTITTIEAGASHSVALRSDGTVACWGDNGNGQCSVPPEFSPGGLGTVTQIAAGYYYTVALRSDGSLACWGQNNSGQCSTPTELGHTTAIAAGPEHTLAIRIAASANLRSGANFNTLAAGILNAANGDTLLVAPFAVGDEDVDYRGKSLELRSTNAIARGAGTTTLFANGARLAAPESIAIDGVTNVPTNAGITIQSGTTLSFAGNTTISLGGSILAQNDGSPVSVNGTMTLATNAVFNPLAPVALAGRMNLLGGVLVADTLTTATDSELVAVDGTINVDTLVLGGDATLLDSAIVSEVSVNAGAQLAASGQIVGSLANSGRTITTEDLVVVGDVANATGSQILAQVGVLYITGDLVNNGIVVGNVITAPGFKGGGTGGTQVGDGIRVAGSVEVGAEGALRFIEDLWKFSVCGDMSIACAADDVRFNGAKLSLDGCDGTVQTFEATSRDLGCIAAAFSGEETEVSLIGELDVATGATVSLVDNFNNAPGKSAEVVYARGLTVKPGATLVTNGIRVITRNALIEGTVDDPSNICVVVDTPDPDVNGDGLVNGIDLAFVLTYWGSSAPIADLNDDGVVAGADLAIVLDGWTS